MKVARNKPNDDTIYVADVVSDVGNIDYVKNGEVVENAPVKAVMVANSTERDALTGYEPGTIAFTAGFANIWQLSAAGTWVEVSI